MTTSLPLTRRQFVAGTIAAGVLIGVGSQTVPRVIAADSDPRTDPTTLKALLEAAPFLTPDSTQPRALLDLAQAAHKEPDELVRAFDADLAARATDYLHQFDDTWTYETPFVKQSAEKQRAALAWATRTSDELPDLGTRAASRRQQEYDDSSPTDPERPQPPFPGDEAWRISAGLALTFASGLALTIAAGPEDQPNYDDDPDTP